ncbi:MAG: Crp/Fnr family transcriptional regulator [Bacteriovoracaceae bacterium]
MSGTLHLEPEQILIKEGERSDHMYWLQQGQLIVVKRKGSEEVTLGHVCSGELVGELSFLDGEPRSATVRAVTACELIEIPRDFFDSIFKGQPRWLETLVKTLAERLRKANSRIKV